MKEQAWIQDPKTANTMRFHLDPKSWSAFPMYFVDSGRPLTGEPPLLKTRGCQHQKHGNETAETVRHAPKPTERPLAAPS